MEIGDTGLAYFPLNLSALTCAWHNERTFLHDSHTKSSPVLYVQDNGIDESPRLNHFDNQIYAVQWRGAHDLE
jgi:hypothetical protein